MPAIRIIYLCTPHLTKPPTTSPPLPPPGRLRGPACQSSSYVTCFPCRQELYRRLWQAGGGSLAAPRDSVAVGQGFPQKGYVGHPLFHCQAPHAVAAAEILYSCAYPGTKKQFLSERPLKEILDRKWE